jgi:hypothetical protein
MNTTRLTQEQRNVIVEKILALRELSRDTTMKTNRSQTKLLDDLCPDDLAEVSLELKKRQASGK